MKCLAKVIWLKKPVKGSDQIVNKNKEENKHVTITSKSQSWSKQELQPLGLILMSLEPSEDLTGAYYLNNRKPQRHILSEAAKGFPMKYSSFMTLI